MKKAVCVLMVVLLLSGCAGRAANPISTREPGDAKVDCEEIAASMKDLDARSRRLMGEQGSKTGSNVAWGVATSFSLLSCWEWICLTLNDKKRWPCKTDIAT